MSRLRDVPRFLWFEPRAPSPRGPGKRDGLLLAVLVAIGLVEGAARPELSWSSASLIVGIALMPTVLWRRSRPLMMVSIAFGAMAALSLARLVTGHQLPPLHTGIFLLLLPYALFRWGAGREVMIGSLVILADASFGLLSEQDKVSDIIAGFAVLLTAMALGVALRYRNRARSQELEQVKLREREELARDLHDTVAHHVSAIAVRAQAGLATLSTNPAAAADALRVIEAEASRTLAEMRAMVRILRRDESAELVLNPGIAELERLADPSAGGPDIDVDVSEDTGQLSPAVSAAIYRLAQESITNARRHARHATRIQVEVTVDETSVRLRVTDDGDIAHLRRSALAGYGLVGMTERAEQLGGTCQAGPNPERGWTVTAVLPRNGPTP
jgi:signal transduction histidine kinase